MVAFETLHTTKRCSSDKNFKATIKLDKCKAYDRTEWRFFGCDDGEVGFLKRDVLC